jgi:hypothetical protein
LVSRAIGQILLWLAIFCAPTTRPATQPTTRSATFPIDYRHVVRNDPPLHLHIATVDLTDRRVHVRVCGGGADPDGDGRWQTTLATVRDIATRDRLDLAVNGSYFSAKDFRQLGGRKTPYFPGNWAVASGSTMVDGRPWRGGGSSDSGTLVVDSRGHVSVDQFPRGLPADTVQAVSGAEMIVTDGRVTATTFDRVPHTAAGINRDATHLVLLVVDGRRPEYSVGISGPDLAKEMIALGCWRAIQLDGGGSSTMVLRDASDQAIKLMNHPSDGHDLPIPLSFERCVADALGVTIDRDAPTSSADK